MNSEFSYDYCSAMPRNPCDTPEETESWRRVRAIVEERA